uniref:FBA domain-containing protein n=1 Tax=Sphenodon punctatus TaxID=8508 RepID=A0A8D0H1A7_SPHPU
MGIGIVCLSPRETPDVPCVPTDAFLHWEVEHGGGGGNVEENRCPLEGAEAQTCFVSSFQWCTKLQLVDLLKEGLWVDLLDTYQPEIYIFDWVKCLQKPSNRVAQATGCTRGAEISTKHDHGVCSPTPAR